MTFSPGAAYVRRRTGSALVKVMACHLFRRQASTWTNVHSLPIGPLGTDVGEIRIKTNLFIQENLFENVVYEILAILSRGRWINV